MTMTIEDPLIAAMTVDRVLPLHESSRRLRELYPQCPRVYGVAVLADVSVRRWWPLESAVSTQRLQTMFDGAAEDMDHHSAARQLAATLVHTVIGRVVALVVLEARAWDTGLENLWVACRLRRRYRLGRRRRPDGANVARRSSYRRRRPRFGPRGGGVRAQRGGVDDLGRPPLSPHFGITVRQIARGQWRRAVSRGDVAHCRLDGGGDRNPSPAAGRGR